MKPAVWWLQAVEDSDDEAYVINADDLIVKTFSIGIAAQQVSGKGLTSALGLNTIEDPEEQEIARRKLDIRQHLVTMRSRNAELDPETGGRPVIQQEDLQEWLDNLQLRLKQACSGAPTPAAPPSQPAAATVAPGPRPPRPSRAGAVAALAVAATTHQSSVPSAAQQAPGSSSSNNVAEHPSAYSSNPIRKFKLASGAISNPIIRPRSINGLADQAAAALTDGQYIERLQVSLQQASVSSLHERLAERKIHSIQLPTTGGSSVRPKTSHNPFSKSPVKYRNTSPTKGQKKHQSEKPAKVTSTSSLPATSPVQPNKKTAKNKGSRKSKTGQPEEGSDGPISNSTSPSSNSLDHLIARHQQQQQRLSQVTPPVPGALAAMVDDQERPARPSFVGVNFFDCGQTVEDIYQAAEHLLLPPARRDAATSEQSAVQYENTPVVQRQISAEEEEIPIVEDFWGAVPDY